MLKNLKNGMDALLNLIFPRSCIQCGLSGTPLCDQCITTLPPATQDDSTPEYAEAIFRYRDDTVKKIIWSLKYKGDSALAGICARILHERIIAALEDIFLFNKKTPVILIPVPASRARMRIRGFNQSELLSRALGNLDMEKYFTVRSDIVQKIKKIPPQTSLKNRSERIANVRGSFRVVDSNAVKEKYVLIIDDVCTTGGTLNELKKVLEHAGAKKVLAFVLAH